MDDIQILVDYEVVRFTIHVLIVDQNNASLYGVLSPVPGKHR